MQRGDEELVRLHLQGDRDAFCELVDRYTKPIYNLAYRYTGDRMEAENIARKPFYGSIKPCLCPAWISPLSRGSCALR